MQQIHINLKKLYKLNVKLLHEQLSHNYEINYLGLLLFTLFQENPGKLDMYLN